MMRNKNKKGNFKLYNASAGSGKTFTLIKEFFLLSLSFDNPTYKDILAVTFTNKAANEMKSKILDDLRDIINGTGNMCVSLMQTLGVDELTLKKRALKLYNDIIHNYSDLSISTIDAFAQQISRSFAKELNLPLQYKVLLDSEELLEELIQRIDKHINKENKLLTKVLEKFLEYQIDEENSWYLGFPIKKFVNQLLKESAYKKGGNYSLVEFDENKFNEVESYINKTIESYRKPIALVEELSTKYNIVDSDYNKFRKQCLLDIMTKINEEEKPSKIAAASLNKFFDGEKYWYVDTIDQTKLERLKNDGVDVVQRYKDAMESYKSLYLVNIVKKNLYLYVLRGTLMNIINQYIEETNKVHISEFNKRISDIIGDCSVPFIYERIDSKYKHFFIDEFQDTSVLQWFNFLPLFNNTLSEGNMNMLVGDAKQAIYRFRSGEVEQIIKLPNIHNNPGNDLTNECENTFKNEISKEYLKVNYRSEKNIIIFNNSFFRKSKEKLTNEEYRHVYDDNMEQNYRKNRDYDGLLNVEIFDMNALGKFFTDNKENLESKTKDKFYQENVKKSILNDISALVKEGYQYSDIAILVRSNSEGSDIAEFLTKNNIRVISSDSILLKSSDKVRLMINSLRFVMNEDDAVTRLALSYYHNLCHDSSGNAKTDMQNVLDFDDTLSEILGYRDNAYSIYDLCGRIVKFYGFNVLDDVFLHYFMNLVHEWQSNENDSINAFLEYWDRKSDSFCVKAASEENAVQIMTIHKSKGLAFKVVMYPYAITKIPDKSPKSEKWLSFQKNYEVLKEMPHLDDFMLPINSSLVGTDMERHYDEEYDKQAFDDFNIMYVAMTRPIDALYIYTNNEGVKDNNNFFVNYFDDNDNHYYNEFDEDGNETSKESFVFEKTETEFSDKYRLGEIKKKHDTERQVNNELTLDENQQYNTIDWYSQMKFDSSPTMFWASKKDDLLPQEWGSLVHEILSKINTIDDAEKILEYYVNEGSIDEENSDMLMRRFMEIVNNAKIKSAYSKEAVVRNEMDIITSEGKMIRPDRCAELVDKYVIIDYKTGRRDEKYYVQLQNYMLALKNMGIEKKIEAYIVYIGEDIEVQDVFLDRLF